MKKTIYSCDVCEGSNEHGGYYSYNSLVGYCDNSKCKEIADEKEYNFAYDNVMYDAENGNTPDYNEVSLLI